MTWLSACSLLLLLLASASVSDGAVDVDTVPRLIGTVALELPAFVDIHESQDQSLPYIDRLTLYISTFNPFAFLKVFFISF